MFLGEALPRWRDEGGNICAVPADLVVTQLGRRRSIHSRKRSRARRNGGTSSANSISPSGSIHSPKNGRILKRLAPASSNPAGIRTQRDEGRRSQRTAVRNLSGSRLINLSTRYS